MVIPQPAHVEVGHVAPECQEWLNQVGIQVIPMSGGILAKAAELKKLIGVVGDNYNTKGVDENDLLVIATAITRGDHLVSDEAVQLALPSNPAKFKIPAVCQSYENGHPCTNIKGMIIQYGHMGLAAPQPAIA